MSNRSKTPALPRPLRVEARWFPFLAATVLLGDAPLAAQEIAAGPLGSFFGEPCRISLLQRLGIETDRFSTGTGTLPGLEMRG